MKVEYEAMDPLVALSNGLLKLRRPGTSTGVNHVLTVEYDHAKLPCGTFSRSGLPLYPHKKIGVLQP